MSLPKELSECPSLITLPVLWGDMDAFGHVNNTRHIRWFESSRIDYIEQSQMHDLMSGRSMGPILAAIHCNYRRQLRYPDTLQIGARVTELGKTRLTVQHFIYSQTTEQIAADGESTVVLFDYDAQRPMRIPAEVVTAIERLEGRKLS